jgi:hypothetical protein
VADPVLINGGVGAVWASGGRPRVVFEFTFAGEWISAGSATRAGPAHLDPLAVTDLTAPPG